jgi:hypothetical protein
MTIIFGDAPKQKVTETEIGEAAQAVEKTLAPIYRRTAKNAVVNGAGDFLIRESSYIVARLLLRRYPEFKFREHLPVVNEGGWATDIVNSMYDRTGDAKITSPESNDIAIANAFKRDQTDTVKEYKLALQWSYSEMQALIETGSRIKEADIRALGEGFEKGLNRLALFGEPEFNKLGMFTDPTITTVTVPAGASGSTRWEFKTPAEILSDLQLIYTYLNANSRGTFTTTQIAMSNAQYQATVARPRGDFVDTTIQGFARSQFPSLEKMFGDSFMDNLGADQPTSPTDPTPAPTGLIYAMERDEENMQMAIPQEMLALPPEYVSGNTKLIYLARAAGFINLRSPAMVIFDGI